MILKYNSHWLVLIRY